MSDASSWSGDADFMASLYSLQGMPGSDPLEAPPAHNPWEGQEYGNGLQAPGSWQPQQQPSHPPQYLGDAHQQELASTAQPDMKLHGGANLQARGGFVGAESPLVEQQVQQQQQQQQQQQATQRKVQLASAAPATPAPAPESPQERQAVAALKKQVRTPAQLYKQEFLTEASAANPSAGRLGCVELSQAYRGHHVMLEAACTKNPACKYDFGKQDCGVRK